MCSSVIFRMNLAVQSLHFVTLTCLHIIRNPWLGAFVLTPLWYTTFWPIKRSLNFEFWQGFNSYNLQSFQQNIISALLKQGHMYVSIKTLEGKAFAIKDMPQQTSLSTRQWLSLVLDRSSKVMHINEYAK